MLLFLVRMPGVSYLIKLYCNLGMEKAKYIKEMSSEGINPVDKTFIMRK